MRGAARQFSLLHPPRPRAPTPGTLLPLTGLPQRQRTLWNSSILQAGAMGWTLASTMRNELSLSRQGIQASMALPSLPTLLPRPHEGCASSSWPWWRGLPGPLRRHPHPQATWLAQLGKVWVVRASSRAPSFNDAETTQRVWPCGQGHTHGASAAALSSAEPRKEHCGPGIPGPQNDLFLLLHEGRTSWGMPPTSDTFPTSLCWSPPPCLCLFPGVCPPLNTGPSSPLGNHSSSHMRSGWGPDPVIH